MDIEQKALELLAAEYDRDGWDTAAGACRSGHCDAVDRFAVRAIVAALTPPEGYVLVPVEATEAMYTEGQNAGDGHDWSGPADVWAAMLAARPEVP